MIDNFPTAIVDIPCLHHQSQKVSHVCMDNRCQQQPYLCQQCFSAGFNRLNHATHEESLMLVSEAAQELAKRLTTARTDSQRMFLLTFGRRDNQGLIRKITMGDQHLQNVEQHIKNIKLQIEIECQNLEEDFVRRLQITRQSLFNQLDNYFQTYVSNMESFKHHTGGLVAIHKKYRHYNNQNCISMKMMSELKRKSSNWLSDAKKALLSLGRLTADKPTIRQDTLHRCTQHISSMCDELPTWLPSSKVEQRGHKMQQILCSYLTDFLQVKDLKPLPVEPSQEHAKLGQLLTPTSTTASNSRKQSVLGRSPLEPQKSTFPSYQRYDPQKTSQNSSAASINRTIIRTNRIS